MERSPAAEYAQRMNNVIDYIDRHLAESIDLAMLAEVAHFSPFHFHRLFASWMGETMGDYVRRRRLEAAALLLAHHARKPVLDIALEVGFGSGEAFSRAFKEQFGMTPSAWRRATPGRWSDSLASFDSRPSLRKPDQPFSKMDQVCVAQLVNHERSLSQEFIMQINIVTLPPVRVAYMRHIGPYGPRVSQFWQQAFMPWRLANGLEHAPCYGIGHDDPDITPADKCRYDACVAVPEDFVASAPASITHLPGGRYAVADFRGAAPAIHAAWASLLRDWLPSSGMQPDSKPFFEYYPAEAFRDADTDVLTCQLCLPVKPI